MLIGGTALWVVVGLGVALALRSAGHDAVTVALSVGCWPLFVGSLDRPKDSGYGGRIAAALRRVTESASAAGADAGELDTLRQGLLDASARLSRIDALLRDDPDEPELLERRRATVRGLDAALADLSAIRLQFSLMSVDGVEASCRPAEALDALRARVRTARELRG